MFGGEDGIVAAPAYADPAIAPRTALCASKNMPLACAYRTQWPDSSVCLNGWGRTPLVAKQGPAANTVLSVAKIA